MRATIAVLILTLAGCANPPAPRAPSPQPPEAATSPCADARYQELREKSIDDMTDREYEYFLQRDRACTEHQRTVAQMEPQREAVNRTNDIMMVSLLLGLMSTAFYLVAM